MFELMVGFSILLETLLQNWDLNNMYNTSELALCAYSQQGRGMQLTI